MLMYADMYAVCTGCVLYHKNNEILQRDCTCLICSSLARDESVGGVSSPMKKRGLEAPAAAEAHAERSEKRLKCEKRVRHAQEVEGAAGRAAGAYAREPSRRLKHLAQHDPHLRHAGQKPESSCQPPSFAPVSCENLPEKEDSAYDAYDVREEDVGVLSSAQNGGGSGGGHRTLGLSRALAGKGRMEAEKQALGEECERKRCAEAQHHARAAFSSLRWPLLLCLCLPRESSRQ
jgi:hypothetical protein